MFDVRRMTLRLKVKVYSSLVIIQLEASLDGSRRNDSQTDWYHERKTWLGSKDWTERT